MIYCKRCLYPENHPLHLIFDSEGVCSGCRVHEEKDVLDWHERAQNLGRIFDDYRSRSGKNYDCIIPVSGARDSYFIVHTVKNVFKMNPLLVSYNQHYNTDIGIRNLAYLRIKFNCDYYQLTVSPEIVKKITRATMRKRGSIYWHCIAGQTVYPVQMAVQFKIPLIVWGAHQGVDQVGMFSHLDEVEMTRKYRKEHDLMGLEAEDLVDEFDFIEEKDMAPFVYPDDKEIEKVGVRGIYLNNYIRWDSKKQHEDMIRLYGYETALQTRTFDNYNDIDSFNYSDVHDHIKFLKWGYGKVNDHVAREIRLKRMTAQEGVEKIDAYLYRPPKNLSKFLEWIGMTERAFNFVIDQHRSPSAWKRNARWEWELKSRITKELIDDSSRTVALDKKETCDFVLTSSRKPGYVEDKYILIGKGAVGNA
ncbi:MAG TPA: N-acetyl sugar amidotransferase [Candidatus Omnitrophota bacterium]|nr:N-acetyl sugar amidotransferase [Candidatus Omnitrophota bacterium]HPD84101.1 N-acetyl sugar amidotransferase [Candidatus Omnitrophota bacterium]HRZ02958.1 N-acetyl sugar amidotransferase [Candidatus Omnitrophota bacterium]